MIYQDGFVVSIIKNGEVLRENNNHEVFLPFGSEYKIRLRNKNRNKKATASIRIDGTNVLSGNRIIIPENDYVDLERFCVDGNLSSGNKFKFVDVNGPERHKVQDPSSELNGLIEVSFYEEKDLHFDKIINDYHHHHHYHHHHYKDDNTSTPYPYTPLYPSSPTIYYEYNPSWTFADISK